MKITHLLFILLIISFSCKNNENRDLKEADSPLNISGIYPHLAYYNNEAECGTGAVVSWAGRLWVITYGPHLPHGSSDKLYEITPDLEQIVRPESIGGTPANRMIHKESAQLFIGPYAIDSLGNIRVIPYEEMTGRHTGNARHLSDPENKIYYATMEEGFYEVNVHNLEVTTLFPDSHNLPEEDYSSLLPGAHGKGLYSGQGVLVYSNNGELGPKALTDFDIESGVLAEWDGENWNNIRRDQFVEVTGPGGIYGNPDPETDPVWTTGWDHKSAFVGVRDATTDTWSFYRIPKASHSYDGAHGWNTEWPRIRNIGTKEDPEFMMTMHGMFWDFPSTFSKENTSGIRPLSAYLKVIGDFASWKGKIVFGCDDSAQKEFLNKRKVKGNIQGPGQSNSNLWFVDPASIQNLGPSTAGGAVWLDEKISAFSPSEPFLFSGWPVRTCWIDNQGEKHTSFIFKLDKNGSGEYSSFKKAELAPGESRHIIFNENEKGEWIKVETDRDTRATLIFSMADEELRDTVPYEIFGGLAPVDKKQAIGGLLYGLGNNQRSLGISAFHFDNSEKTHTGYYELNAKMELLKKDDPETREFINETFAIPEDVITIEESSVLIIDDKGRRWRLPLGKNEFTTLTNNASLRLAREVATERDLFNCHGTFFELPAENADGFAKIRPISSHNFRIHDYASYRGMLIMTGIDPNVNKDNPHIFVSDDGNAAVWAGVIDDLWKLGKPTGHGGPWKNSNVTEGIPSDPYLIGFYDRRTLTLFHNSPETVTFTLEIDPLGHGPWMEYKSFKVNPGEELEYLFPDSFEARWIRFRTDKDAKATAWLEYE